MTLSSQERLELGTVNCVLGVTLPIQQEQFCFLPPKSSLQPRGYYQEDKEESPNHCFNYVINTREIIIPTWYGIGK